MITKLKKLVERREELKRLDFFAAGSCSLSGKPYSGKYKKQRKKIEKEIFNLIEKL